MSVRRQPDGSAAPAAVVAIPTHTTGPDGSSCTCGTLPPRVPRIPPGSSPGAESLHLYGPNLKFGQVFPRIPRRQWSPALFGRSGNALNWSVHGTWPHAADRGWRRRPRPHRYARRRPRPAGTSAVARSPPPVAAIALVKSTWPGPAIVQGDPTRRSSIRSPPGRRPGRKYRRPCPYYRRPCLSVQVNPL